MRTKMARSGEGVSRASRRTPLKNPDQSVDCRRNASPDYPAPCSRRIVKTSRHSTPFTIDSIRPPARLFPVVHVQQFSAVPVAAGSYGHVFPAEPASKLRDPHGATYMEVRSVRQDLRFPSRPDQTDLPLLRGTPHVRL